MCSGHSDGDSLMKLCGSELELERLNGGLGVSESACLPPSDLHFGALPSEVASILHIQ